MNSHSLKHRIALIAGTAVAAALLSGCAGSAMTVKANSADAARLALSKGQTDKALSGAEAAVAASPRDVELRVLLAQVYFKSGRFQSAATTYDDAMKLGDNSARTALSLALAQIGAGQQQAALSVLDDWRGEIPASDLGLALALAGEPERGVAVLADALRGGDNSPKVRQNLAYAYALAGRWKEARVMAGQDVPAEQLDKRLTEWAESVQPEAYQQRVAALVGTPVRKDPGQPAMLALANNPAMEQLAAETTANAAAPVTAAEQSKVLAAATPQELPAVPEQAPPVEAAPVQLAEAAPQPAAPASIGPRFVAQPVVQSAIVKQASTAMRVATKLAATASNGSHLVQIGSFSSPQGARRAWGIYSARNPKLANYRMVITPANVRGKNVWRVAAAGLDSRMAANGLCSSVKSHGGACFAYAASPRTNPTMPGQQRSVAGPALARKR